MTELLTATQMREIEQRAMDSGAISGLALMERAGQGVADAILDTWPDAGRVSILCGPGNNGGDGFVIARLLAGQGRDVTVWFYGDADRLSADARRNHDRWLAMGQVRPLDPASLADAPAPDLWVDAVFGTGLTRPPAGVLADVLGALAARADAGVPVVAVDAPSGLCLDSGRRLGGRAVARCALTVAFDSPKIGHMIGDGPEQCGHLVIHDIGLRPWREALDGAPRPALCRLVTRAPLVPDSRAALAPLALSDKGAGHKFTHGHALVLSGGFGRTGAARLAARAALRTGAGLVTLGAPGSAQLEIASQITALMLIRINTADDLAARLTDPRLSVLCLGPGLGPERARDLVPEALRSERPVVLDADALSAFAQAPDDLLSALHGGCVLTPHGGEFARLFPDLAARLTEDAAQGPAFSKVDAARAAAARAGCTVLLKGADTVIADPDGQASVHAAAYERAAPWLATAGSGDVLAGIITGLLARGLSPHAAAATGAWLHVGCARAFGPGLIAEDLPEMLPQVLRQVLV
ncbi:MAG: NAD(P)H-hydrate dehydratase [Marinibacterium sp.]|nr:NAD(P)H-hydrate dehydratase [Marinibacterium sp.]